MTTAGDSGEQGGRVMLAHGGGGELTNQFIRDHLLPHLGNEMLAPLADSAVLPRPDNKLVFTTDSYVVTPLEFPGGDIGRLAVAGTVNDLAVMGAKPLALSLGLILEEGLPFAVLDRIIASIAATAREAGVSIVTGDTKVIERRQRLEDSAGPEDDAREGIFINTAGVGSILPGTKVDPARIEPGDVVLVNGAIAEHGLTVMSVREGLEFETELRSDAAPLNHLLADLFNAVGEDVKFVRDATRSGIAGVLADICEGCNLTVEIEEAAVPLTPAARHAAEMLGLDPLSCANEGKVICVVGAARAEQALAAMRGNQHGRHAACIGKVVERQPALVELLTRAGGRRVVQRPYGEELPRIC